MIRILLIEDDPDLNATICDYLGRFFEVEGVVDEEEGLQRLYEKGADVVILDVKLPGMDGFEVARHIRTFSKVPIIFLTSLDSEKDVERGFLSGGDDYIRKPFSLKELKLRVDAILKRVYGGKEIKLKGGYRFDLEKLELRKGDKEVHLKPKEAELLKIFIQNRNRPLSTSQLLDQLYRYGETPNPLSLRTFINRLRRILGKETIVTIKGVGYKFVGVEE